LLVELKDYLNKINKYGQKIIFFEIDNDSRSRKAVKKDMESNSKNYIWSLTTLLPRHKAIFIKWIYMIKKRKTSFTRTWTNIWH
jgi:hypothetical protein